MKRLLEGIVEFKRTDFEKHKELFKDIGRRQNPHTLFIGCSDSRIIPNMITNTLPGELFVVRNIANIVPPFRETNDYLATTSAIEYAVKFLKIDNIIVCGHSNCGGCASLFLPDEFFKDLPHTKKWLELTGKTKEEALKRMPDDDCLREELTEQLNVVEQMKHLLTYPFIKKKYEEKQLQIRGWYYIIETGEVYNYNLDTHKFEPIN